MVSKRSERTEEFHVRSRRFSLKPRTYFLIENGDRVGEIRHDEVLDGWTAFEPYSGAFPTVGEAVAALLDKRGRSHRGWQQYTFPVVLDSVESAWKHLDEATSDFRAALVALVDSGVLDQSGVAVMLDIPLETVEFHLRAARRPD